MNQEQAIKKALTRAAREGEIIFVVYEDGEYHVATEHDMHTWFQGCEAEYAVDPDGGIT